MGALFVKQPNGLLARFHTASDWFTHWDLTATEAIDLVVDEARSSARLYVQSVLIGGSKTTWEECVADASHAHGSDAELTQVIADANRPVVEGDPRQLTLLEPE
jgi:hypothetical protein